MAEVLIRAEGLSKRFQTGGGLFRRPRSMLAVRNVSFEIAKGEVLGVVGESGCGKSTLARLILRLIEPSSGAVRYAERDMATLSRGELRAMRRRMAMVFQDSYSALDPRYKVGDVLEEPFRVQGEAPPKGRVTELLAQVGLDQSFAARYPHQLSGGQRQRIGIARALAQAPEFIVLDEPTASLDVSIQAQIIGLLSQLRQRLGLSYLFISHDLGLVRYFCDRIMVMYLGSVVEILPHPEAKPRHPYTAALMESRFLPDPSKRKDLRAISGEVPSGFDLLKGCAFAARCPRVSARCRVEMPELSGTDHKTACFHPL